MIERGVEWGRPGRLDDGAFVAEGDAELAAHVQPGPGAPVGLRRGDLARTLGIRPDREPSDARHLVPVDAIEVTVDDHRPMIAMAHVVIGRPPAGADVVAVMNAAFLGHRNLAPRAHPGDGVLDVVSMRLAPADRLKAWRRMTTASHVPHADIEMRRRVEGTVEIPRARRVSVDGRSVGRGRRVHYRVVPGAVWVAV